MRLPPEDPRSKEPDTCGRLRKSLYGTRDAGANWHASYTKFLTKIGMKQGVANPCHFIDSARQLRGIVHGDDFLFSGTRQNLGWLKSKFEDQYACKVEVIGRGPNDQKAARFLNRVITYDQGGITFEADQRLAEAIIAGMDVKDGNTCSSPGTKAKPIPKAEHQAMMERRMSGEGGRCIIANLKAQIGRLEIELRKLQGRGGE